MQFLKDRWYGVIGVVILVAMIGLLVTGVIQP
jgi:hypothetical protein